MKKTTILAATFLAVMGTSAHAEIRNDLLPGDRIKEQWDANNQFDSMGHFVSGTPMAKTTNPTGNGQAYTPAQRDSYDNMTPDQRAAHRTAMHKKWAAMTPAQQAQAKAAHKAKWDAMTPAQQAQAKADHKAKWDAMTPAERQQWQAKKSHMTNSMSNGMTNSMTNGMHHSYTHSMSPATTPATGNSQ